MRHGKSTKKTYKKKATAKATGTSKAAAKSLAKKVNILYKARTVPEKKFFNFATLDLRVGQYESSGPNVDGIDVVEISPIIAQGAASNQRIGSAVTASGMYMRLQVIQQASTVNILYYNVTIVRVKGRTQTGPEVMAGMYDTDSISGLRDYNAPRNISHMKEYQVLYNKNYTLKPDSITGQTGQMNMHIPLKLKYVQRYDISGLLTEGQLFIIVRAASGNYSVSSNTGAVMYMGYRYSYTDA